MFGASSLVNTKRGGTLATYDLTTTIPSNIQTGDILNCPYSGTYKSITLPKGTYKLECWGAQGGNGTASPSNNSQLFGGKGGYSYGVFSPTSDTVLYLYSGGQGSTATGSTLSGPNGGYNGGGAGSKNGSNNSNTQTSGGGGGATHIATTSGLLNTLSSSTVSILLIAGGGGGAGGWYGSFSTQSSDGGYGGGNSGGSAANGGGYSVSGGTQSSGYSFGQGASASTHVDQGGGGGGYYGGYCSTGTSDNNICGGGGGSGYINTSKLTSASTIAGNTSFIGPTGEAETGHSGNGYVRITVIEVKTNLSIYIKNSAWKENNKILFKKTNWINHKDIYMKFNPQSLLPSGYTALEYIESTGTQYINTGFKPKTTSRIQMRALPTKTVSSYTAFFGCRTDSSPTASDSFNFAVTTATTIRSDYFGTNQSATVSTILTDTIIDKKQNILTAYGQTITNKAKTSEQSSKNNLTIFALNTASKNEINYYISMKLYYCKIWDNGSLVRNLIPAKNSSGTLGLYDAVNNTFYTNAGTGTFTAGPIATTSWVKIGSL